MSNAKAPHNAELIYDFTSSLLTYFLLLDMYIVKLFSVILDLLHPHLFVHNHHFLVVILFPILHL